MSEMSQVDARKQHWTGRPPDSRLDIADLINAGRGWEVFDHPVALELEVSESWADAEAESNAAPIDDGRYPGFLERLFASQKPANPLLKRSAVVLPVRSKPELKEDCSFAELHVALPQSFVVTSELMERLLLNVTTRSRPTSFEIVASEKEIVTQFAVSDIEVACVEQQIKSHFPECVVSRTEDYLKELFMVNNADASGLCQSLIIDFGLKHEFFYPLQPLRSFDPDPLIGLMSAISELKEDENFVLQVLFQPARGHLAQVFFDFLTDESGNPRFQESKDLLARAKQKLSRQLMVVAIRCCVKAPSHERRLQLVRGITGTLDIIGNPNSNRLIALHPGHRQQTNQIRALINRQSYRKGMMLNISELTALAHLPSTSVITPILKRRAVNTMSAPMLATQGELILGENHHLGESTQIRLNLERRTKHMHLVGASGSGKSSLLTQIMYQDLEQGNGFSCLDPHGDLIDAVLERIPENRLADVVVFDPADEEWPVAFNILSAHSELEKTLLSSDLVAIFRRFATSWGDQMNSVLSNAVLAFLQSTRGGNLIDLKRFLVDRNFRYAFLETVQDEEIRFYWQHEFPELRGKPYTPLLTRLDTFLRSKLIRNIVAQRENRLDFRAVMDEQKILLVKLSLGAIGEENAYLLGSLLVAKIYMAALSRQEMAESKRKPYYLYLDEAHHFLTPSMNQILSGVRKYKLGLTMAHQQLAQFQKADADTLVSLLSNCHTRICFRVDDADAERLAKGFSFFTADHLRNLGVGEAIARFEQSQFSFNLRTFPLEKIPSELAVQRRNEVIERSRQTYGKAKAEVEAELRRGVLRPHPRQEVIQQEGPVHTETANNPVEFKTGRGGRHHQELQNVIRRMAEKLGFQVEIEKPILGGGERVDVSLEKDDLRVACEVSVTTTDYEIRNAEKCLAEGNDHVVIVAANQRKIPLIKQKLRREIPAGLIERVKVCSLMDLLAFLQQLTQDGQPTPGKSKSVGQRLNFKEACGLLGKSQATLYRWVNEGKVPFYRVGREYQFDRDELLLIGKHDLSGKQKVVVDVEPLKFGKEKSRSKKEQDARYRKLLKLD